MNVNSVGNGTLLKVWISSLTAKESGCLDSFYLHKKKRESRNKRGERVGSPVLRVTVCFH